MLALLHAGHPIENKVKKKKREREIAVNAMKICEMEPLSILWKMVQNGAKVPDDHVMARAHTPGFRVEVDVFSNFGYKGLHFHWSWWQQHRPQCNERCPAVVSKVSMLLSAFI